MSWDPPPRMMRERAIEDDLHRQLCEQADVLSVRRQYRVRGNERADLVLLHTDHSITVVEVKAHRASLATLRQVLRYIACMKMRSDPDTKVRGVIAAPLFTKELEAWVDLLGESDFIRLGTVYS